MCQNVYCSFFSIPNGCRVKPPREALQMYPLVATLEIGRSATSVGETELVPGLKIYIHMRLLYVRD